MNNPLQFSLLREDRYQGQPKETSDHWWGDWVVCAKRTGRMQITCYFTARFAWAIWNDVVSRMRLTWVMPRRVVDLFLSWYGSYGISQVTMIWNMVPNPIYLPWCIWRKWNNSSFEDCTRMMDKINTLFLWTYEIDFNGLNVHDFLVSVYNSRQVFVLYMTCILGLWLAFINKMIASLYIYKKKVQLNIFFI